ncbi:glycine-rich domain-containing protein [Streptomyces sp. NPDC020379]|uniref:glycine-rich domain-containing protein n=1 Tax=Streptomyces sp. NPDC020379 TaxID=3365071 RepID=UPI00379FBF2F
MSTIQETGRNVRELLSVEAFSNVTATVLDNNPDMEREIAERIVAEAIKFVVACAAFPGESFRPSRIVDEGWHALILNSHIYTRFCNKLAGRYVHHVPQRPDPSRHDPGELERTQAAITRAGYTPDRTLWLAPDDPSITVQVRATCEHSPPPPNGTCTGDCSNTGPN